MDPDDEAAEKMPNKFWMALMDRYAGITMGYENAGMGGRQENHRNLSKEIEDSCGICGGI